VSKPIKIELGHGTWWLKLTGPPCLPAGQDGSCDPPDKRGRRWIYIADALVGLERLETICHEYAHAADPQASEETIEERARVEARLLWDLGYRLMEGP